MIDAIDVPDYQNLPSLRQVELCYVNGTITPEFEKFYESHYNVIFKYQCRDGMVYLVRFPMKEKLFLKKMD